MKKRAGLTAYELPQAQPKGLTGPRSGSGSARGGHRKPEATPVKASGSTYDNLNELTARSGSGTVPVRISGSVNEPASITVNSQSAQVVANTSGGDTFTAWANLSVGANLVAIQATDNGAGGPGFNPKSEIGRADLPQSVGGKWLEKISPDPFGYASIFSNHFPANILRHLDPYYFGFPV